MPVSISINLAENSYNTSNNTSNVTVQVLASYTAGSYNQTSPGPKLTIYLDGSQADQCYVGFNAGKNTSGTEIIYTNQFTITHNSDGTKTLYCSAEYASGVSSGTVTASNSVVLTTITNSGGGSSGGDSGGGGSSGGDSGGGSSGGGSSGGSGSNSCLNGGPHNYNITTVAPTCTDQGYDDYYCPDCGEWFQTNYTAALGHSYDSYVTTDPTCIYEGFDTYYCSRCGDTMTKNYTSALGHNFSKSYTVAPTCTRQGYDVYECSRCTATERRNFTDILGHNYSYSYSITPTRTEQGGDIYHCDQCGDDALFNAIDAYGSHHSLIKFMCPNSNSRAVNKIGLQFPVFRVASGNSGTWHIGVFSDESCQTSVGSLTLDSDYWNTCTADSDGFFKLYVDVDGVQQYTDYYIDIYSEDVSDALIIPQIYGITFIMEDIESLQFYFGVYNGYDVSPASYDNDFAKIPYNSEAFVRIENGVYYDLYQCYIDDETAWNEYEPYMSIANTEILDGLCSATVNTPGDGLNLRNDMDISSKFLVLIPNGTDLTITDIKIGADGATAWAETTYKSKTGWCVASYLDFIIYGIVNKNGTPLYTEATSDSNVLLNLIEGPELTITKLSVSNGLIWGYTSAKDQNGSELFGYVQMQHISISSEHTTFDWIEI
jgi:hypothetical protein